MFAWIKNIPAQVKALFIKEEPKLTDLVEHSTLASSRLWVTIGFALGLIWLTHGLLTETNIDKIYHLALAYLAANTLTRVVQTAGNVWLKGKLIDKSFSGKDISAADTQAINSITVSDK